MNLDGYSTSSNLNQIETELSSRLHDALKPSIPLHLLKKNVVDVFVMVLQDDGGAFDASVAAASLALADAGMECYDLVSCFTVAVVPKSICFQSDDHDEENNEVGEYHLLADPSEKEILVSKGLITLAMMKNWKDVVFWNQTGSLPPDVAMNALELAKEGCAVMHKLMRQALLEGDESNLEQSISKDDASVH
jgi:exosome complex component MTR3